MSIDDKLREILFVVKKSQAYDVQDWVIPQIKRVFTDADWKPSTLRLKTDKHSAILIASDGKTWIKAMTGREWVEVYNKMLKQIVEHEYGTDFDPPELPKWLIEAAAKRAAGLEGEDE